MGSGEKDLIEDVFNNNPHEILAWSSESKSTFGFSWGIHGIGFGMVEFYIENNRLVIASKNMSRTFVKECFNRLIDKAEWADD